jgi:lysine decarboxylase
VKELQKNNFLKFDIPIHRGGRWCGEMFDFYGENVLLADNNSMKMLDNLVHPMSVICDSEKLTAEAFGADKALFIVNGTTAAVQAMILYACKAGDKIIMPRNVHKSVINALVLCGAVPIYVNPGVNEQYGISLGMSLADVKDAINNNPDAKAILVNNPTCYGICSNLKEIIEFAHAQNILVLVDEAYGAHFYFGDKVPDAAMHVGADMSAIGMHKTGGSLTQSSLLLCKDTIDSHQLRQLVNLSQTTSASYLLLISLELARKNMFLNGERLLSTAAKLADCLRCEINKIGGYHAFEKDLLNGDSVFNFDLTKLFVSTQDAGLSGKEVYDILRDKYNIQMECADICNILAIISPDDNADSLETNHNAQRLIVALREIKNCYSRPMPAIISHKYIEPDVVLPPQTAFYNDKKTIPIDDSENKICAELLFCYPPGIPLLAPGERITREIIDCFYHSKDMGCEFIGIKDLGGNHIDVVENERDLLNAAYQ